jgi:hypothetical protein
MTNEESRTMDRIIGGLQAQLEGFQQNWQEQDRRAAEGRRILYQKIEGFGNDVIGISHKLEAVINDVKEMKPAVEDWVASKNQAKGAAWSAKIVYVGLGAVGAGALWLFNHFVAIVPHG